jgi:TonB family protein
MRRVTRLRTAVAVWILLGLSACVDAQLVPVAATGQSAPSGGESGSTTQQESVLLAVAATAQPSQLDAYLNSLQDRFASHLRYPDMLRRHHVTGRVEFVITLRKNGHIAAITLFRSSGKSEVDLIAEEAIRDSIPLPPLPPSVPGDELHLHAAVTVDPDYPSQDRTVGSDSAP